jgi:hypothetical protein
MTFTRLKVLITKLDTTNNLIMFHCITNNTLEWKQTFLLCRLFNFVDPASPRAIEDFKLNRGRIVYNISESISRRVELMSAEDVVKFMAEICNQKNRANFCQSVKILTQIGMRNSDRAINFIFAGTFFKTRFKPSLIIKHHLGP